MWKAYITSVLNTPAGCQVTTTPGCSNVMAMTATLLLWVVIEMFQLVHTIVEYRHRKRRFEKKTRRKDEWKIWTRGFEVGYASPTVNTMANRMAKSV